MNLGFAPRLNQSPFVPAEAGTQFFGRVLGPWVPASAGTNEIERRFKLSSSRSDFLDRLPGQLSGRLRLELVQQDRVAFAVEADCHAADRALDDVALEGDVLRFEIGNERIEILDLECDRPAGGRARLLTSEVGQREAAAARQVVFDPPLIAAIAVAAE